MLERQRKELGIFQTPQSKHTAISGSGTYHQNTCQRQQLRGNSVPRGPPKAVPRSQSVNDKLATSGSLVNINEDNTYAVFISSIEIYNNYIYDLLDDYNYSTTIIDSTTGSSTTNNRRLNDNTTKESKLLKEDNRGGMFIKDVAEIEVKSTEEALELMHRASKRRVVASTDLNSTSSRSHSIFTLRVVQAPVDNTNKNNSITVSQLSLVDLAGSERIKRTKNTGSRLKEAGSINSSLMALRNCMEVL
jgi:kinesin family member 23